MLFRSYRLAGREISLYGIASPETPAGGFDYYELYEDGLCLNEGDPFFSKPNLAEIERYISTKE